MNKATKKKSTTKKANKKGASLLHKGLWQIIFSYVGFGKDLANCRLVCKKWKKYFKYFLNLYIMSKTKSLDAFQQANAQNIPQDIKEEVEEALKMRKKYLEYLQLIPKQYSLFRRVSDIGKLNTPPGVIRFGIIAVMYLITPSQEVKKNNGNIDWAFCKRKLCDKDFMKLMRQATPEAITKDRIDNYTAVMQASLVTPTQLHRESTAAALMLEWAEKILEYKNFVNRMFPESKAVLEMKKKEEDMANELNFLKYVYSLS